MRTLGKIFGWILMVIGILVSLPQGDADDSMLRVIGYLVFGSGFFLLIRMTWPPGSPRIIGIPRRERREKPKETDGSPARASVKEDTVPPIQPQEPESQQSTDRTPSGY